MNDESQQKRQDILQKISRILDFRELTTGEGGRHLPYLHTQACPGFVHPSLPAYPSHKEHVHRHLCLSRCCKHWTRETAVCTREKKTLGKKMLHGRKHGRWLQTRACPSCLCHHSIITPSSPPLSLISSTACSLSSLVSHCFFSSFTSSMHKRGICPNE